MPVITKALNSRSKVFTIILATPSLEHHSSAEEWPMRDLSCMLRMKATEKGRTKLVGTDDNSHYYLLPCGF